MIVTFDPVLPKTVPPTYSWDEGIPSSVGANLIDLEVDSEGYYIGYAPFALVRLSSVPVFENGDESVYTVYRALDFNDYYNCSPQLTSLGFDQEYFCHVYVMPGTYDVEMSYTIYSIGIDSDDQRTVLYQQEALEEDESPILGLISENDRERIYWKWDSLLCDTPIICDTGRSELGNTAIPWISAAYGEYYHKTWNEAEVLSTWAHKKCERSNGLATWANMKCSEEEEATWEKLACVCLEAPLVLIPFETNKKTLPNKLKILEILPIAYLSAAQPDLLDRVSPLSAILTARFTKTGSFPIEKIVWDLGDGSPFLTQRRWAVDSSYPFLYTGALSNDPSDPRNYDVQHVYNVTKNTDFTFYPSITAYAYSTGTADCASTVIGPIQPQHYNHTGTNISLLQNNVDDQKTFTMLYQIEDDVVAAKFEKQ
jgi:hypothetical protein